MVSSSTLDIYAKEGKEIWEQFTIQYNESSSDQIKKILNNIDKINEYTSRFNNLYNNQDHSFRIIYYLENLILMDSGKDFNDAEKVLFYLASFLHDLGKPSKEYIPNVILECLDDVNHLPDDDLISEIYIKHNEISACLLKIIAKELGWPNNVTSALQFICEGHNMGHQIPLSLGWIRERFHNIETKYISGYICSNYKIFGEIADLTKITLLFEMADTLEDIQPYRSIDNLLLRLISPPINNIRENILKKSSMTYDISEDDFTLTLDIPQKVRMSGEDVESLVTIKHSVETKYTILRKRLKRFCNNGNLKVREIEIDINGSPFNDIIEFSSED